MEKGAEMPGYGANCVLGLSSKFCADFPSGMTNKDRQRRGLATARAKYGEMAMALAQADTRLPVRRAGVASICVDWCRARNRLPGAKARIFDGPGVRAEAAGCNDMSSPLQGYAVT